MKDDDDEVASSRSVAAIERSLELLEAFLDDGGPLSLAELRDKTGLFKSLILRYLISFEAHGLVHRDENGLYRLGATAFRLGKAFENSFDISSTMQPVLQKLMEETGETASVYVRDGDFRFCLLRAEPPHRIVRIAIRPGMRLPIDDNTATSLILKRFHGKNYDEVGPLSIDDVTVTAGRNDPMLASISAPLFGPGDIFVGSLTLSGVNGHFDTKSERMKKLLFQSALTASKTLGANLPK